MMSGNPRPDDVWLAHLGLAAKTRPVVVVSRHDPEPPRALVICVPFTTQNRGSSYEVALPRAHFLQRESVANVQRLGSIPTSRLERKIGVLPALDMVRIKSALNFVSDLAQPSSETVKGS